MTTKSTHLTRNAARKMAESIRRYWSRAGHEVDVYIENENICEADGIVDERGEPLIGRYYWVRSNLINGLPRGCKTASFRHLSYPTADFNHPDIYAGRDYVK